MPFRYHRPVRFQWLILPTYTLVSLSAIVIWTVGAFVSLGGWGKSTAGARLFIFGLDGVAIFVVIGICVAIYLVESATYANYLGLTSRIEAHGLQERAERESPPADTAE